ncbi:hypothetical protein WBG99_22540 [Streptomyces sp. TG1A-60]|uniref:hypothetical protein n=1 Tax=Streptomyces sp. TG1A-60 TaxID=3129111 RepID=UPI0030D5CEB9
MTEKLLCPLRTRPWPERWLTRLLGAALAAVAYLLCLPWDLRNRPETAGSDIETTPVSVTGVVVLALALLVLAAYFGHRDALAWPLLLVAVPPTALMYASFRAHPAADASLWPLAWAFFTLLTGACVLVAASVARAFRGRRWRRWRRSGWSGPVGSEQAGRSAVGRRAPVGREPGAGPDRALRPRWWSRGARSSGPSPWPTGG